MAPVVNITTPERVGRIVMGAAASITGALLLGTAGTFLNVSLEALLILAGLDLVITGALGHYPLYRKLMMMACCVPMLVIAGALVVTGVVNAGFLLYALGCTAMMALMMRGMGHGRRSSG